LTSSLPPVHCYGFIRTSIDNQEVAHGRRQYDEEGHAAHREELPDTEQTSEDPAPSEAAEAVDGVQDEMAQARDKTRTCAFFISGVAVRLEHSACDGD
jgi:2',3'-cyclic-nucleotide 2'-phosphodiesterase (5'-nucleotidase family)